MSRNYRAFYAILNKLGLEKEDVVSEFTSGRTDSLRALTDGEFRELMLRLGRKQSVKEWKPKPGDAQRKKLIAIAGAMHWGKDTLEIVGKLNVWMKGHWGKELNEYDENELNRIVWVMENKIYKEFLKSI